MFYPSWDKLVGVSLVQVKRGLSQPHFQQDTLHILPALRICHPKVVGFPLLNGIEQDLLLQCLVCIRKVLHILLADFKGFIRMINGIGNSFESCPHHLLHQLRVFLDGFFVGDEPIGNIVESNRRP